MNVYISWSVIVSIFFTLMHYYNVSLLGLLLLS